MKLYQATHFCLFLSFGVNCFQPVDINLASVEQIALLDGVGIKTAQEIVSYRNKHGKIANIDELSSLIGLNKRKIEVISKKVFFDGSAKNKIKDVKLKQVSIANSCILPFKEIISFRKLEEKVFKASGLDIEIERSLRRRVRKAAYLPQISVSLGSDTSQMASLKKYASKIDRAERRGALGFTLNVRAAFDFEKLIYNPEELQVLKVSLLRQKERERVVTKLQKAYFTYVDLAQRVRRNEEVLGSMEVREKICQAVAVMDSLSDGAFSRNQSSIATSGKER